MSIAKKPIGEIFLEKGMVTEEQLKEAEEVQKQTTQPLGQVLVDLGFIEERMFLDVYSKQLGVPAVDLSSVKVEDKVLALVPGDLMQKHQVLPLRLDGKRLIVAMADPKNVFAIDDLRMATGYDVRPVLAAPARITSRIPVTPGGGGGAKGGMNPMLAGKGGGGDSQSLDSSIGNALKAMGGGDVDIAGDEAEGTALGLRDSGDIDDVKELVDEAPIIKIVNAIFQQAILDGASDIHIEPQRRNTRVRYRVDGVLHEVMKVPQYVQAPLLSRVKIMSEMNIAERRIPQDGRIHIRLKKKDYDMRVSTIPTTNGEKAVMRILDKSSVLIGLDKLGLYPEDQKGLEVLCAQPNGMVLSTGPTGSGKTTTQYSVLNIINSVEKNIITIEDPVEYQLPGLSQVAVNRKAGLTFGNALRSFVRQDPDIIMVGEIRDLETAEIAIQASLTGHLVLSTLHTNDAASAVTRLVDMGVEPFLISASVIGVMAQRLARKVCENCKEPHQETPEALSILGYDPKKSGEGTLFKGKGCDNCRYTGYRGRLGLYELLQINAEIADLVVRRAPVSEIKQAAIANGMKTLQEDGLAKILDGLTTLEEIMRVVLTAGH